MSEKKENSGSTSDGAALRDRIELALRTVFDPEIPVNIYELGLIYDLAIDDAGVVAIQMTLTSPACPVAGALVGEVEMKVKSVAGVTDASVELVWDPPWTPDRMTDAAKLQLNMDIDEPSEPRGKDKFTKLGKL